MQTENLPNLSPARFRWLTPAVCVMSLLLAIIWIMRAPRAVSSQAEGRHAAQADPRPPGRRMMPRFGRPIPDPPWEEVEAFMQEHCQNRLQATEKIRDTERRDQVRQVIINRYKQIQRLRQESQKLYDLAVKEAEIQDQIFGSVMQLKRLKGANNSQVQGPIEADLKKKVTELLDNQLAARKVRLERLQATLKTQQERLEADARNHDQLVEKMYAGVIRGALPPAHPNIPEQLPPQAAPPETRPDDAIGSH